MGIGITTSIIGTMITIITGMTIAVGRAGWMAGTTGMAIIGSGVSALRAG